MICLHHVLCVPCASSKLGVSKVCVDLTGRCLRTIRCCSARFLRTSPTFQSLRLMLIMLEEHASKYIRMQRSWRSLEYHLRVQREEHSGKACGERFKVPILGQRHPHRAAGRVQHQRYLQGRGRGVIQGSGEPGAAGGGRSLCSSVDTHFASTVHRCLPMQVTRKMRSLASTCSACACTRRTGAACAAEHCPVFQREGRSGTECCPEVP